MKKLLFSTVWVLLASVAFGQLTGTKTIPGDYPTLNAAISDLNTQGVGPGGVIIELLAGNPETAPAGGYVITASGNPNSPIVIRGNGNTITAPNPQASGLLNDAFFKIIGGDYITIDGFVMQENPSNTTTTAGSNNMTEFGVALFYASATDGPQNCTIQNNTITLGAAYQNAFGIYATSRHTATAMTTAADITSPAGAFSFLKILNNTISSVNLGVVLVGSTTAANMATNVEVIGNNITYGRTGTFSGYISVSGSVNGIYLNNVLNATVNSNVLTSNGTSTSGTLRGIYYHATGTIPTTGTYVNTFNSNTITITNGANTAISGIQVANVNAQYSTYINGNVINNLNSTVALSSVVNGIFHEGTALNQIIQNNTLNINTNTSGSVNLINGNNTIPANGTQIVQYNNIKITKNVAGGTVYGYYSNALSSNSVVKNISNNTIENVILTGATAFSGIYDTDGGAPVKTISNNVIRNVTGGTSAITAIFLNYGVHHVFGNNINNINNGAGITAITAGGSATTLANVYNNEIWALTTSSGSVSGLAISASATGAVSNVYANRIFGLSANAASSSVTGIAVTAGTNVTVYNNFVSELYTPAATSTSPVIAGIAALGGTNVNLYYNTVYINATSTGTEFSTCALFANTTPASLRLNNNIFVNTSTANGAGITAAFRRAETSLTKYHTSSSNNCFFAGTLSASNLVYFDGTNGYQDIVAMQTAVAPRELASISVMPPFVNITTSPYDLHIQTTVSTGIESGGITISGIDVDIDNNYRFGHSSYTGAGIAPDIGADEFEGVPNYTCTTPNPGNTISTANPICFGQSITLSFANVPSGTGITYQWQSSLDGITYNNIAGATASTYITAPTTETYYRCLVTCLNGPESSFTTPILITFANSITSTTPASRCGVGSVTLEATGTSGATIEWFDAPTGGNLVGTGSPFNTPSLNATTTFYVQASTSPSVNDNVQFGTQTNVSTNSAQTPFCTIYEDGKHQYLYLASELNNAGYTSGTISSIAVNITSVGSPAMSNFKILMGQTTNNALTASYVTGLTEVFSHPSYTFSGTGWQTITLNTPFTWDGTSNLVIQFCYGNNTSWNSNSNVQFTNTSFNSHIYGYMDNGTGCNMTNPTNFGVNSSRINIRLYGTFTQICSSPRVPVVATIGNSDPISITPNITVCNNEVVMLEVLSGLSDYDQFTWTPIANLYTDAACTVPYVAGTSATQVFMKTTASGNHVYTCNALNTSTQCAASENVTVSVLPTSVPITANPSKICNSGSAVLSVPSCACFGNSEFQWYESTDGTNWTLIPSANSLTYTTPAISSNTYYKFTASVNSNTCLESVKLVEVTSPSITSVNHASICGANSAVLSATAGNANTTILWYEDQTGGYPIAVGNTYTTPVLNNSETYFVEPFEQHLTFNVGKPTDPSGALASFGQNGMYFATTNAVIINSVDIYPSTAGTLNVVLVNNLSLAVDVRTFTITSMDISTTNKKTLNLNFYVPENATGWMLYYDLQIYRGAGTYAYPYTANGFSITGNGYDGNNVVGGTRMYFYNWQVTSLCTGPRAQVDVNFTTPPSVSISASANNVCAGTNITLEAQSTNNNYTYTWSNNATGNVIVVSPSTSTSYNVTATDAQTGCVTSSSVNLNIYPNPVATATAAPTTITCGQTVQLTAGSLYSPEVLLLENFNSATHIFTTVNNSTGGNPSAAAWTLRPNGYVYGGVTFNSPDNSQFIMSNSDAQGSGGNTNTELISPTFSSVGIDSITIQFSHFYRHYSGSTAKVEIFDGSTWTTLQSWTTTQGAANNFANVTIPLSSTYMNNPNLQIRFVYTATWGYYWAIDNVKVNLFRANTFSWTSQPLGFTSNISNPTDAPTVTTQYIVTVTSYQGCTSTANVTVTVNNLPAPTVTVNNTCDQSELTVSNYNGTINWSTGESTPTIYVTNANPVTVTYTVGNCTSNAATANPAPIQTPNQPVVSDIDACFGETVPAFNATSNYNQFIWYSDPQLTNQIGTGSSYQSPATNPGTYTYYVVAVNNGCVSTPEAATLTIYNLPNVVITQNGNTLFSSVPTGNQWYNTQGPIAGATNNYYIVTVEDTYYVVVTDVNGCSAVSNTIHVIPTHVAQNEWNNMIAVHPNPAHNYTVVSLGKLNDAKIQIVSMDGRILSEIYATNNKQTVSLKGIASGIYTVRVIAGDKIVNKKLIVE